MQAATVTDDEGAPPRDADSSGRGTPGRGGHRGKSWVVAWIAAFLAVVLGAELAVRAYDSRLPEARKYFSGFAQTTVHDMNVLERNGIESDLTFVGTSMVRRDIDPNRLEIDTEGEGVKLESVEWAHNVALPGAQTTIVERWMLEEVVPRIKPERVVWGISTLDFNSARPDDPIDQYSSSRASKTGFYADVDRVLWNSALSEHRDTLRDPYKVLETTRGKPIRYQLVRPLDERATWELGYKKRNEAQLAKMRRAHLDTIENRQLLNFTIGREHFRSYANTIEQLQRQGIEVVIMIMPVTQGYLDAHPEGEAQFMDWKDRVIEEAERQGATVLDMWDAVDDMTGFTAFRDYEHLTPAAAREFTDDVATRLAELGW